MSGESVAVPLPRWAAGGSATPRVLAQTQAGGHPSSSVLFVGGHCLSWGTRSALPGNVCLPAHNSWVYGEWDVAVHSCPLVCNEGRGTWPL